MRERLSAALREHGVECVGDWQLSDGAPDYRVQLAGILRRADAVVPLLSRTFLLSRPCRIEVRISRLLKKRIIPAQIRRDFNGHRLDRSLRLPQWTYLFEPTQFTEQAAKLAVATRTDFGLVEVHTWLTERAHDWALRHQPDSALLRSKDLERAREGLARLSGNALEFPKPTSLQRRFVSESERAQTQGLRRRLTAVILAAVALGLTTVIAVIFWQRAEWLAAVEEGNRLFEQANRPGQQLAALERAIQIYERRSREQRVSPPLLQGLALAVAGGRALVPTSVAPNERPATPGAPGSLPPQAPPSTSTLQCVRRGADQDLSIVDGKTGAEGAVLAGTADAECVAFALSGVRVATRGNRDTRNGDIIKVWDVRSGSPLFDSSTTRAFSGRVEQALLSPAGDRLAAVANKYNVVVVRVDAPETPAQLSSYPDKVHRATFSPDGIHLLVHAGAVINVFDTTRRERVARIHTGQMLSPELQALSRDGALFLTSTLRNAHVWRTRDGELLGTLPGNAPVREGVFSDDGRGVTLFREGGTREEWAFAADAALTELDVVDAADRIAFAQDGTSILIAQSFGGASPDAALIWRRPEEGVSAPSGSNPPAAHTTTALEPAAAVVREQLEPLLRARGERLTTIASAPDGALFAVVSCNAPAETQPSLSQPGSEVRAQSDVSATHLRVWDAHATELFELVGATAPIEAIAYSPDGQRIAALSSVSVRIFPATPAALLARAKELLAARVEPTRD